LRDGRSHVGSYEMVINPVLRKTSTAISESGEKESCLPPVGEKKKVVVIILGKIYQNRDGFEEVSLEDLELGGLLEKEETIPTTDNNVDGAVGVRMECMGGGLGQDSSIFRELIQGKTKGG